MCILVYKCPIIDNYLTEVTLVLMQIKFCPEIELLYEDKPGHLFPQPLCKF